MDFYDDKNIMTDDITTFNDIFTENELNMFVNDDLVQSYKMEAIYNNDKSIKFKIAIGEDIKSKLKSYNIDISGNELSMMWIKGDIDNHVDKGQHSFEYTNLIYLTTDYNGRLIIDGKTFPIKKGYGYRFKHGLEHETIDTDPNSMRLMIGPISKKGLSVGAGPTILYMLYNPPDYSKPYFMPPDNTKFINSSQLPSEFVVAPPYELKGWYVFYIDDGNALYKVGDIVPPNTPYNMDYTYWVYPIWEIPPSIPASSAQTMGKSTYTNNSLVFYKPHSLAPGGTAGVKNVRAKSRRT